MIALFIAAVQDLIIGGGAETQDNDAQGARWRCSRTEAEQTREETGLRLGSEGRAKRSLEEKQGGSWIEAVQCRESEERRGACERNVGIVCLLLHC